VRFDPSQSEFANRVFKSYAIQTEAKMMIYNTIMVQVDIDGSSIPRLTFAWDLANRFEADLIVFAAAEVRIMVPGENDAMIANEIMRQRTEEIGQRLKVLEGEFESVTREDARASWRGLFGNPTRLLELHSRAADLVVIGVPEAGVAADHLRTVDAGGLILSAGRPVLLASSSYAPVEAESVLVAWKDTREARRAVVDAMPFLTAAREVVVATIEEADRREARESAADVVRFLMKHGAKARSEVIDVTRGYAPDALVEIAREVRADLIVSGGYGHSRLREWAFGGVTKSLLQTASLHRLISN
jgi:nucleotide-binding universal stress UspA family protein